jgi:ATP-dependent DNA ligase
MQLGEARSLPGIFDTTIFSPQRVAVPRSIFIKAMHPKTQVSPNQASVKRLLDAGWVGQMKVHGHRAQIHISSDPADEMMAYNRQGRLHKKLLPEPIIKELRRLFAPYKGWTVLDTEWLKPENKLYVFDVLKHEGKLLRTLTYAERYAMLPRMYISPFVQTLPLLTSVERCMEILARTEETIEGLVFKSLNSKGFEDTSIVRCRKRL